MGRQLSLHRWLVFVVASVIIASGIVCVIHEPSADAMRMVNVASATRPSCCTGASSDAGLFAPSGSCDCVFDDEFSTPGYLDPQWLAVDTWIGTAEVSYGNENQCITSDNVWVNDAGSMVLRLNANNRANCPAGGWDAALAGGYDASTNWDIAMVQMRSFLIQPVESTIEMRIQYPNLGGPSNPAWATNYAYGRNCQHPNEIAAFLNGWISGNYGPGYCVFGQTGGLEWDMNEFSPGAGALDMALYTSDQPIGCTVADGGTFSCPGSDVTIADFGPPANFTTQLVRYTEHWMPGQWADLYVNGVLQSGASGNPHTFNGGYGTDGGPNWMIDEPLFLIFFFQLGSNQSVPNAPLYEYVDYVRITQP